MGQSVMTIGGTVGHSVVPIEEVYHSVVSIGGHGRESGKCGGLVDIFTHR
jgi:hypothetical protein